MFCGAPPTPGPMYDRASVPTFFINVPPPHTDASVRPIAPRLQFLASICDDEEDAVAGVHLERLFAEVPGARAWVDTPPADSLREAAQNLFVSLLSYGDGAVASGTTLAGDVGICSCLAVALLEKGGKPLVIANYASLARAYASRTT